METAPDHTVSELKESRFKLKSLAPEHMLSSQAYLAPNKCLPKQGPLGHHIVKTDTQLTFDILGSYANTFTLERRHLRLTLRWFFSLNFEIHITETKVEPTDKFYQLRNTFISIK